MVSKDYLLALIINDILTKEQLDLVLRSGRGSQRPVCTWERTIMDTNRNSDESCVFGPIVMGGPGVDAWNSVKDNNDCEPER